MTYSKIKKFFTPENSLLLFIAIASAVNTYLYLYLKINRANFFKFIGIGRMSFIFVLIIIVSLAVMVNALIKHRPIARKFLLVFLPTEMVLFNIYVLSNVKYDSTIFNYTLRPFIGAYLIFACFYFLFKYKGYKKISDFFRDFVKKNDEEKTVSKEWNFLKWLKGQKLLKIFIIVSVIALNLGFGSYHISEFAAVDEPLWTHDRIPKFWSNVADGEFNKTMISDKPGITVAIVSGIALNWINPMYYKNSSWEGEDLENFLDAKDLNFALRFPILIFNCLMLLIFYAFIKKLLGEIPALISLILIGLSPLLLGISTIINPDGLLWTFAPLSLIAYLAYLKSNGNKYLYFSGIFLGLAILTKYVANILYVFFFGLIFLEYVLNRFKYEKLGVANYFKKAFADYFIVVFFSLMTFYLLLPAAWVDINRVLEGTILSKAFYSIWPIFLGIIGLVLSDIFVFKNKIVSPLLNFLSKYRQILIIVFNFIFAALILLAFVNTYSGMKFFDFETILASPKTSKEFGGFLELILANVYSLIFGLAPLAFLALFFGNVSNISSKKKSDDVAVWFTYITIFIILYYLASTIEGVSATVRYQILIYPLAMILAAIGIHKFISNEKLKKYIKPGFACLILLVSGAYSLNFIKPFYFSYASDLLPKQYVLNLKDMGDGSYEAADYLNKLPNAENLMVWTDKRGVCSFFVGNCMSGFDFKDMPKFDYFVVSSGRESRTSKMTAGKVIEGDAMSKAINEIYSIDSYDYKLEIGERPNNFVKIISAEKMPN
jgi:4-amino-4-deoxy-L-arabinose transferase-like glycosyltransferase